jgi:nicotinate (nicotinamide) nucleotide adenylyltransferase
MKQGIISGSKVGIIGGSFDPPTLCHLDIAESLLERNIVDIIWFMPCRISLHNKILSDANHRLKMLEILISKSKYSDRIYISEYDLHNDTDGSTYSLVTSFLNKDDFNILYGDVKFYFVIGTDNAFNIDQFKNYKKLINLIPFIVLYRHDLFSTNDITINFWFLKSPHKYLSDIYIPEGSSTDIRYAIKDIKTGLYKSFFKICDYDIFKYIIEKDLYVNRR